MAVSETQVVSSLTGNEIYQLVGLIGVPSTITILLLYILHKDLKDQTKEMHKQSKLVSRLNDRLRILLKLPKDEDEDAET